MVNNFLAKPQCPPRFIVKLTLAALRLCERRFQFRFVRVRHLSGELVLTFLLGLASLAGAEPTIMTNYDYYDIEGRTAAELRQQMNIYGVAWTNGSIYDAYTGWDVKWNYRYRLTDENCSIQSVTTTLTVYIRNLTLIPILRTLNL